MNRFDAAFAQDSRADFGRNPTKYRVRWNYDCDGPSLSDYEVARLGKIGLRVCVYKHERINRSIRRATCERRA
jgi:hypothetical protein